ncbi:hypothetical protein K458DRAFT_396432 [Lentithecium fluviatile CBS 122367]|uniref:Uncharacterized protein n=1 Tax=Lentithecium fluviatile CBS 122367 TaxID=1168545 RepID=A0A6G1IGH1_9PLEO|nr:hypothetical protein K458DRAFT_396432 [Lentithecium fluviatile CBS 122367]
MNSSRSRRLHGSLGDSWGDADYSSDGDASLHSASSLSDAGSESDYELQGGSNTVLEEHDVATPLPPRTQRASSQTPRRTPTRTPANRTGSRSHQSAGSTPRSFQSTPDSQEPSFIMPSMRGSIAGTHDGSPLRHSQLRTRRVRQSSRQSQPSSMNSSPQLRNRRIPAQREHARPTTTQQDEAPGPGHYLDLLWANFVQPLCRYILEVVWYAMNHHLKPLLGTALTAFLIISLIQYSSGVLTNYIHTALTPICIIPGSSYLLPFCSTSSTPVPYSGQYPDFEELVKVQSTFEDVLEVNKDSYALPATLKKGEMALRDLRSTVKYSRLPSRSELEVELSSFIETASEASDHLSKYNAKIGYTMDRVISTNRWTLTVLDGIAAGEASTGSLVRMLSYIVPFGALQSSPESMQERIFDQYTQHVSKVKDGIDVLIQQSLALLALLTNLENRLDIIAEIAIRDDLIVSRDRDELLSLLWTKLGGNRSSKKAFADSLTLLRQVQDYRKSAVQHVSATLLKLQEIAAELENLREGVAAPEVLGFGGDVPLQFHIEVVGRSIERLRDARGETLAIEREAVRRGLSEDGSERLRVSGRSGEMPTTVYAKAGGT